MTLYRSDWKPSEHIGEERFFRHKETGAVKPGAVSDRGRSIDFIGGTCPTGWDLYQLGPRIDPPREDTTPTQEIRIPVAQHRGVFSCSDWMSEWDEGVAKEQCEAFAKKVRDVKPDRIITVTARIPIPAPQPDIEVEGEVQA